MKKSRSLRNPDNRGLTKIAAYNQGIALLAIVWLWFEVWGHSNNYSYTLRLVKYLRLAYDLQLLI